MTKYRNKYEFTVRGEYKNHVYTCIGARGAIHFHVTDYGELFQFGPRYSGGLEVHYRQPPDYMRDDAPSQDKCWLIGCPCWHDGTSLYASEFLIPYWQANPQDHDRMFCCLEKEYRDRFEVQP